jgi:hypothetical protein
MGTRCYYSKVCLWFLLCKLFSASFLLTSLTVMYQVRFWVLTVANMKTAFWDIAPCSLIEVETFQRCVLPPSSLP